MPSLATPAFRTLLRTTLRPATTQTTTQFPHTYTFSPYHAQQQQQQQQQQQRCSTSPPPPYQTRSISLLASTQQWTRFTTPYTLSSVRTFTRSAPKYSSPPPPQTSPEAAQKIESIIEQITDMYGTARDEFEIAAEETEKNTTYAEDDRAAAREELDRLLEFYKGVVEGDEDAAVAEEVKRRVGQRVRELEHAVLGLEESVKHGD